MGRHSRREVRAARTRTNMHEESSSEDEKPEISRRILRSQDMPPVLKKQVKSQNTIDVIDLTKKSPKPGPRVAKCMSNIRTREANNEMSNVQLKRPSSSKNNDEPEKRFRSEILKKTEVRDRTPEVKKVDKHQEKKSSSSSKRDHKNSKEKEQKSHHKKIVTPAPIEEKESSKKSQPTGMPVLTQRFKIKSAVKDIQPARPKEDEPIKLKVSMPVIEKPIEPLVVEKIKPIRFELEWAHPKDPQFGEVKTISIGRKKKTHKNFATTSTQTLNGNVREGAPFDLSKYINQGLTEFFQSIEKGLAPDQSTSNATPYIHLPYNQLNFDASERKLAVNVPIQIKNPGRRMQINAKAKVPTGTKNNQCDAVSSTSNGAAAASSQASDNAPKKSLVPGGAFESQPLWKKEDVWKLGSFKDRYDFPKKKRYAVPLEELTKEDEEMFQRNQLEEQKEHIERLRNREIEMFGDPISDDDASCASSADADFSDDEGNLPKRPAMKPAEELDLDALYHDMIPQEDADVCFPDLDEEELPEQPAKKNKKKERYQKEDDEISFVASSFGSFSPDRMDDFNEPIDTAPVEIEKKKRPVPGMIPLEVIKAKHVTEPPEKLPEAAETRSEPIPEEAPDDFQYYHKICGYFCDPFKRNGKCGYGCKDLQCGKNLDEIPLDHMKQELKQLCPAEIKHIYRFCTTSFACFNKFFKVLSSVLGAHKLTTELTAAISVCEKQKFDISYYKWVVDGLIRANFSKSEAIQILLTNKKCVSARAMRTILEIILGNELLQEFFAVVHSCAATPAFKFEAHWVYQILKFCYTTNYPECADLLNNIIASLMTDEARAQLYLEGKVEGEVEMMLLNVWQREYGGEDEFDGDDAMEGDNRDEVDMDIETEQQEPEMILGDEFDP